jgi:hypothetical protein
MDSIFGSGSDGAQPVRTKAAPATTAEAFMKLRFVIFKLIPFFAVIFFACN